MRVLSAATVPIRPHPWGGCAGVRVGPRGGVGKLYRLVDHTVSKFTSVAKDLPDVFPFHCFHMSLSFIHEPV